MDYDRLLAGLRRFGSGDEDICRHGLKVPINMIRENVVIAPYWEPDVLPGLGQARLISPQGSEDVKVWDIAFGDIAMTYVKTGIGAPLVLECMLPLGVTACKRIAFVGSVGALDIDIGIGDIVLPEYCVCGDGASRYLAGEGLFDEKSKAVFGEKSYPDKELLEIAAVEAKALCGHYGVGLHMGRVFSIDTIFAQFAHIDEIIGLGCNVIEMETAAAFRAAKLMGIPAVAVFSVSDSTVASKSLISGRTKAEIEYRKHTRRELFPRIIHRVFGSK